MKKVTVVVLCAADLKETWTLKVTDEEAAMLEEDEGLALEWLSSHGVGDVINEPDNEHDRELRRRSDGTALDIEDWVDPKPEQGLRLVVNVSGDTENDIEAGLEEALRRVREGFLTGMDRNETGRFDFSITGEEVKGRLECTHCGHFLNEDVQGVLVDGTGGDVCGRRSAQAEAGPTGDTNLPHEATWTFVGHWDDASEIQVEYVLPGVQDDEREDTGFHEGGLWASSASGATQEIAQAAAVAEYTESEEDSP